MLWHDVCKEKGNMWMYTGPHCNRDLSVWWARVCFLYWTHPSLPGSLCRPQSLVADPVKWRRQRQTVEIAGPGRRETQWLPWRRNVLPPPPPHTQIGSPLSLLLGLGREMTGLSLVLFLIGGSWAQTVQVNFSCNRGSETWKNHIWFHFQWHLESKGSNIIS